MPVDNQQSSESGDDHPNESADSGQRKAKTLVWLVAGSCLLVGGLDLGLYIYDCRHKNLTVSWVHCLWLAIPLVVGIWLLVKTPALADWINDWLDQ